MTIQTFGNRTVAVDIFQDIATMTGGAVDKSRDNGVVFELMTSPEIGVIIGVTGNATTALTTVDVLIGRLQGPPALHTEMTGATSVAALIMNRQDIHRVVTLAYLIMAGNALGTACDLTERNMIDVAMTSLVIAMANHTSGIRRAIPAIGYSASDRGFQGESFRVGLGGSIIAMTKGTGISGNSTVQGIDICLRSQGATAFLTKV